MRFFIFVLALGLCASLPAADWVDQGDGTWTCSVSFTAPTTDIKIELEQCRKQDNYLYRYLEDELSPSDWLQANILGLEVTQAESDLYGGNVRSYLAGLWAAFKDYWVSPHAPDRDALARGTAVPNPPNQP